jgi:hypothetical protein
MMPELNHEPSSLVPLHTVPTHLGGDTVLSLGTLDLTSRQVALLLIGGSFSATVWARTGTLATFVPPFGLIVHWMMVILLLGAVLLFTFGRAAGRSLDVWLLIWLAYGARARIFVWMRSTPEQMHPQQRSGPGFWDHAEAEGKEGGMR